MGNYIIGLLFGLTLIFIGVAIDQDEDNYGFEAGYRKGIMETEEIRSIYLKQDSLNNLLKEKSKKPYRIHPVLP